MRPTLPSAFGQIFCIAMLWMTACHHEPPPVPPGDPIPAEAEVSVAAMDVECDALIAAIGAYGTCPHADDELEKWATRTSEIARQSFDAGKQGKPDEPSQHVIALACRKATISIQNATRRCVAGPRPKPD